MANIYNLILCTLVNKLRNQNNTSIETTEKIGRIMNPKISPIKVEVEIQSMNREQENESEDHKKCRVCLKPATVPIFGSKTVEDLSTFLRIFCDIELIKSDGFPELLCKSCYSILKKVILFRKTAQETDKLLRQPKTQQQKTSTTNTCIYTQLKIENEYTEGNFEDLSDSDDKQKHKSYHCNRCNLDFDNYKQYTTHTKSDEHLNLKVECPVCKIHYKAYYIRKHILSHKLDPTQGFICEVCGKHFSVLGAFKKHKAIHTLELPFKCHLCPYRGRFNETLKAHIRIHTGEKPYACPHCASRFSNKSNLNKHLSTHKTKHDYVCDSCGRGYFRKRDLELHIKVEHCGLKEHICSICGKEFGYRKQMMKHQLKVHKREKFKRGRVPLYIQADQLKRQQDGSLC